MGTETKGSLLSQEIDEIMNDIEHLNEELKGQYFDDDRKEPALHPIQGSRSEDTVGVSAHLMEDDGDHSDHRSLEKSNEEGDNVQGEGMEEFRAPQTNASMEETLLEETYSGLKAREQVIAKPAAVRGNQSSLPGNDNTMTLSLTGKMNMRLNFDYQGQTIKIGFADQVLHLELANGADIKIPI